MRAEFARKRQVNSVLGEGSSTHVQPCMLVLFSKSPTSSTFTEPHLSKVFSKPRLSNPELQGVTKKKKEGRQDSRPALHVDAVHPRAPVRRAACPAGVGVSLSALTHTLALSLSCYLVGAD